MKNRFPILLNLRRRFDPFLNIQTNFVDVFLYYETIITEFTNLHFISTFE